jgi:hypothetical protein
MNEAGQGFLLVEDLSRSYLDGNSARTSGGDYRILLFTTILSTYIFHYIFG